MVPKPIRDAMGLEPGRAIDITFSSGRLEIEVAPVQAHVEHGDMPRIVADEEVPPLTADEVRDTIESTRR